VELAGFKTTERRGVAVSPGERVSAGTITIDVGSLEETVTVTGAAPIIQAQTGERSFVVAKESVEVLPLSNRNYAAYAQLAPGVVTSTNAGAALANNWQIAGLLTAGNTALYDATYTYQSNGANVNITGSPNHIGFLSPNGDIGSGCSSNQYQQFNASAYKGPSYNSVGNESGRYLLTGCQDHTFDLAFSRNIKLGGARQVQFRLDVFNLFNNVVFNARTTAVQYSSPADPTTVKNHQYNADGTLNTARLLPANAGAGAATAAQFPRSMEAQIRLYF
jgi:hypothetical protein